MRQDDMMALREIFVRSNVVLGFNGPFSQSVIEELGEAIRRHLESQAQTGKRIADVFAVYIEMTQNIRHYAEGMAQDDAERADLNAGTVLIGAEDETYTVMSGNLVRNEHVDALKERLDAVLALDPAGLKKAYKERLRAPVEEGATGAGLGFLQMARKAARPLEYSVTPAGPTHSFFSLSVHI
jgi:hypothetical protein